MTHHSDGQDLMARVENLERQARTLKHLLGAVACAFPLLLLVGHFASQVKAANGGADQVLEAQELRIKDASGKLRAQIRASDDTVGLTLFAPNGDNRAALIAGSVTGMNLIAPNGKQIGLLIDSAGPDLGFYDPQRVLRAYLAVTNDGPSLSLYDPRGNARTSVSLSKDGPGLTLYDGNGSRRASLGLTKSGSGLVLLNSHGEPLASLGTSQLSPMHEAPLLALFDEQGNLLTKFP